MRHRDDVIRLLRARIDALVELDSSVRAYSNEQELLKDLEDLPIYT